MGNHLGNESTIPLCVKNDTRHPDLVFVVVCMAAPSQFQKPLLPQGSLVCALEGSGCALKGSGLNTLLTTFWGSGSSQFDAPGAQTRFERTRQGLKPNSPLAATTPLRRTKFRFSDNSKKGQALWMKAGRLESTVLSLTRYLLFRMDLWAGDVSSLVWYLAASWQESRVIPCLPKGC